MKNPKIVVMGHEWNRTAVYQMLLALVSLLSLVLASGAGSQWW
jgi:hypothetical protein